MSARTSDDLPGPDGNPDNPSWSAVWALSVTEIVSWGTLYFAISVLIAPIEREMAWSRDQIVAAYSLGLLFAALGAFPAGILVDRLGGRIVMTTGSISAALLFALLSQAHTLFWFYLIWAGLGLTMSMLLYEPAFAVITVAFGAAARKAITVIAVAGGLASTIFWPLTQALVAAFGWRHTLLVVALIHFAVCVPLHAAFLPGKVKRSGMPEPGPAAAPSATRDREIGWRGALAMGTFWMLAVAFSANMLAYSALTVHLIAILHEKGFSMSSAVWLAALVGPMQVVGRTVEFAIASRFRVSQVAVFALAILPVALLSLGLAGSDWGLVVMFVAACGFSNGIMTIARGTIPATVFGRENYGAIAGMMSAPVLLCRAFGPILGAMIWSRYGNYDAVLWTLAGFALVALNFFHLGMRRRPVAA